MRRTSCTLPLAAALVLGGCQQIEIARLYLANNHVEIDEKIALPAEIPFEENDGWVIIRSQIDGKPIDMVLDSGAGMASVLWDERSEALAFDMSRARKLGDPDDMGAPVAAPQPDTVVDLGPIVFRDLTVLAIPTSSVLCNAEVKRPPFTGVLGHELFSRYVVTFDYDRHVVVLQDPENFVPDQRGTIVPMSIESRQPYARATITPPEGADYEAVLHVDSGANLDVSLLPGSNPAIVVPTGGKVRSSCFVGGEAKHHYGTTVDVAFGDTAVERVPASYALGREVTSSGQNGRLGTRFLRRFNVTFDYEHERMILTPRSHEASSNVSVSARTDASTRILGTDVEPSAVRARTRG